MQTTAAGKDITRTSYSFTTSCARDTLIRKDRLRFAWNLVQQDNASLGLHRVQTVGQAEAQGAWPAFQTIGSGGGGRALAGGALPSELFHAWKNGEKVVCPWCGGPRFARVPPRTGGKCHLGVETRAEEPGRWRPEHVRQSNLHSTRGRCTECRNRRADVEGTTPVLLLSSLIFFFVFFVSPFSFPVPHPMLGLSTPGLLSSNLQSPLWSCSLLWTSSL